MKGIQTYKLHTREKCILFSLSLNLKCLWGLRSSLSKMALCAQCFPKFITILASVKFSPQKLITIFIYTWCKIFVTIQWVQFLIFFIFPFFKNKQFFFFNFFSPLHRVSLLKLHLLLFHFHLRCFLIDLNSVLRLNLQLFL